MFFRWKIQPTDGNGVRREEMKEKQKPRVKQLFERPFSLKNFVSRDTSPSREFEPSSVCLRKMVENYIEDPDNVKKQRCGGRNSCYCFSGSGTDSSSDEEDSSCGKDLPKLKSLVSSINTTEKTLVEKATKIMEEDEKRCLKADPTSKPKQESRLKAVVDGLVALGYDAAICKTRWEKSKFSSYPSPGGDYEYLDVLIGGERLLIDIDFKSKFQIARPTKTYKSISNTLPYIFVGDMDRLKKIVVVVSEAAKKSFKKKGLHVPPWRRSKFVLSNWASPHDRRANRRRVETSFM